MAPAPARALTCVAGDDHSGVLVGVLGSLHDARLCPGRARVHAPVSMLPRVQTVGGASWAMRACHGFDGSRPRSRNHSNVSTAPRAHSQLQANRRSAWGRRLQQRCVHRDKTLSLRDPPRNSAAMRPEMLPMCSSGSSNASCNFFFYQPATGVNARQQLVSTTASKPLVSCIQPCAAAGPEDSMP